MFESLVPRSWPCGTAYILYRVIPLPSQQLPACFLSQSEFFLYRVTSRCFHFVRKRRVRQHTLSQKQNRTIIPRQQLLSNCMKTQSPQFSDLIASQVDSYPLFSALDSWSDLFESSILLISVLQICGDPRWINSIHGSKQSGWKLSKSGCKRSNLWLDKQLLQELGTWILQPTTGSIHFRIVFLFYFCA